MSLLYWLACSGCLPPSILPMNEPAALAVQSHTVEEASELLWQPELRPAWRDPTQEEKDAFNILIPALTYYAPSGELPAELTGIAEQIGMHLERWEVAGQQHFVLYEDVASRRGTGAYLFAIGRPLERSWILLQSPHAYFDMGTGWIGASLYFTPPSDSPAPVAFFTNSLHRYTTPTGAREKGEYNYADACHNPEHLFQTATLAAAKARRNTTVIQLHGFGGEGEGDPPPGTRMVISAGGQSGVTELSRKTAETLQASIGSEVLLYPDQVNVLGATTNVQANELKGVRGASFLHVELSAAQRTELKEQPDRLALLGRGLFGGLK